MWQGQNRRVLQLEESSPMTCLWIKAIKSFQSVTFTLYPYPHATILVNFCSSWRGASVHFSVVSKIDGGVFFLGHIYFGFAAGSSGGSAFFLLGGLVLRATRDLVEV